MTREEVMKGLEAIADCTGLSVAAKQVIGRLSVHDAEQREVIERQAQEIARLREALERVDSLVKWLCGEEGDFGSEPEPLVGKYRRAFWWRVELRKRYEAIKQAQQALKEVK